MLTVERKYLCCSSFKHECDGSLKQDNECLSHPWEGFSCAFTAALDYIGGIATKMVFPIIQVYI